MCSVSHKAAPVSDQTIYCCNVFSLPQRCSCVGPNYFLLQCVQSPTKMLLCRTKLFLAAMCSVSHKVAPVSDQTIYCCNVFSLPQRCSCVGPNYLLLQCVQSPTKMLLCRTKLFIAAMCSVSHKDASVSDQTIYCCNVFSLPQSCSSVGPNYLLLQCVQSPTKLLQCRTKLFIAAMCSVSHKDSPVSDQTISCCNVFSLPQRFSCVGPNYFLLQCVQSPTKILLCRTKLFLAAMCSVSHKDSPVSDQTISCCNVFSLPQRCFCVGPNYFLLQCVQSLTKLPPCRTKLFLAAMCSVSHKDSPVSDQTISCCNVFSLPQSCSCVGPNYFLLQCVQSPTKILLCRTKLFLAAMCSVSHKAAPVSDQTISSCNVFSLPQRCSCVGPNYFLLQCVQSPTKMLLCRTKLFLAAMCSVSNKVAPVSDQTISCCNVFSLPQSCSSVGPNYFLLQCVQSPTKMLLCRTKLFLAAMCSVSHKDSPVSDQTISSCNVFSLPQSCSSVGPNYFLLQCVQSPTKMLLCRTKLFLTAMCSLELSQIVVCYTDK